MNTMTSAQRLVLFLSIGVLMMLTRSGHWMTLASLPDISWAAFFLTGFYINRVWSFVILLVTAVAVDVAATSWGGVSAYCMSPAYLLLIPAYGALWLGGRWYRGVHSLTLRGLARLTAAIGASAFMAEVLSSGGFYLLSGRFANLNPQTFAERLWVYFPSNLQTVFFYVGIVAMAHVALTLAWRYSDGTTPLPRR